MIAVTHGQNQIYLFKIDNERLRWASVREILGAESGDRVSYDEGSGLFRLSREGARDVDYQYAAAEGKLVQIGAEAE